MRALVTVLALAALLLAGASARVHAQPSAAATGFDHNIHARGVDISGADPIACADCHPITRAGVLVGRPSHASCFGRCHGPAPAKGVRGKPLAIAPERLPLCTTCHAAATLLAPFGRRLAVPFPPYVPNDFALAIGHQQHRDVTCVQCHTVARPAGKPAPHRRCASCHDGSARAGHGPAMTACAGCHTPGGGRPLPPTFAEPDDTVTATFSHARHAARGVRGGECTMCHDAIRDTNDSSLPRPTARACATSGCHDDRAAFPITAACTRCHTEVPDKFDVARPEARFSHRRAEHAQATCIGCHPLDPGGEVLVAGHAPCVTCHAEDFTLRRPTKCGACHNGTEPWRRLTADRLPPDRTEFGATLDHAKHPGDCTGCHTLTTASVQLRPTRGHRACTGTACHAIGRGPVPQLATCEGCHQLGLATGRDTQRAAAPWSVRTTFDHGRHRVAGDGNELACTSCHLDVGAATTGAITTPPKRTCAPCHDGKAAFKLTGTSCMRCHPGAAP